MIANPEIYVIGRGFVNAESLTVGDPVYSLDRGVVVEDKIDYVRSDFVSIKLNRIDSGAHNVLYKDALSLYHSDKYGYTFLTFEEIPRMTADKMYSYNRYLPVLSARQVAPREHTDKTLEQVARTILVHEYTDELLAVVNSCQGNDCLVLIDMLEHWVSTSPGVGWLERAQVKSRSHAIRDYRFVEALCRVAALAGFTAAIGNYSKDTYALRISYESMPIPGSRPKNEKYLKEYYTGMVYDISSGNKPILGKSLGRVFYLPTTIRKDT